MVGGTPPRHDARVRRISRATCAHCGHEEDHEPRAFAAALPGGTRLPLPRGGVALARELTGEAFGELRAQRRILDMVRRRCDRCGQTHDQFSARPFGATPFTCLPLLVIPTGAVTFGLPVIPALGLGLAVAWAGYFAWRARERSRLAAQWPQLPEPLGCPHCQAEARHQHPVGTVSDRRIFPCPQCGDRALTHRIVEQPD